MALMIPLLWGGNIVAARVTLAELTPLRTAAVRTALASLTLGLWALAARRHLPLPGRQSVALIVQTILTTGTFACLYLAVERTEAARVAVLVYLYPILTTLLAHGCVDGERLSLRGTIGLVCGLSGAVVTIRDPGHAGHGFVSSGDLLALASACLWACQTVHFKRISALAEPTVIVFHTQLFAMVIFACSAAVFEGSLQWPLAYGTVAALAYQGIVVSAGTGVAWAVLLRRGEASKTVVYVFFTPFFAAVAAAVVLGEPLSGKLLVGVALVTAGVAMSVGLGRDM